MVHDNRDERKAPGATVSGKAWMNIEDDALATENHGHCLLFSVLVWVQLYLYIVLELISKHNYNKHYFNKYTVCVVAPRPHRRKIPQQG